MTACRDDLAITPEQAADQLMYVLERDGMLIGFYGLRIGGDEAELTNLFVEPTTIGFGYGKQLWQHAIAIAQAYRIERIVIESDPHAEMFYRAMGAVRVGDVPSSVIPGRVLPLLKFVIGDTSR
jgi:N-acetylglutamate synthase-like GNAT family acetyltransferase